jgi:phage recombination protein Bet
MSSGEIIQHQQGGGEIQVFTPDKVELLKRTICRGATDDELELFLHACKRTGLDPFMRQIYAVKRKEWDADAGCKVEKMVIQTGIDGYRLIADRTDRYMPGREPTFTYDDTGNVVSATAYVKKRDKSGQWHEIAASALFDEYAGKKSGGEPTMMWASKPHIMLAKCAEALALRKSFPAEMSGVYTKEEMEQADNEPAPPPAKRVPSRPALPGRPQEFKAPDADANPDDPYAHDANFVDAWRVTMADRNASEQEADHILAGLLNRRRKTVPDLTVKNRRDLIDNAKAGKFDQYIPARGEPANPQEDATLPDPCSVEDIEQICVALGPAEIESPALLEQFGNWLKTAVSKPWAKLSRGEQERVFAAIKAGEPWAMAPAGSDL